MGSRLNTTTSEGGQADSEELPLGPPGKPVMRGIKMKGQSIRWGSRSLGLTSVTFIPAPFSQEEEGFLLLRSLDQKVMLLVQDE